MRLRILLLLGIVALPLGCDDATRPRAGLEFSQMEIHYVWSCCMGYVRSLDIYPDGSAHAFDGALRDKVSRGSRILNTRERATLETLFMSFGSFEGRYYSDHHVSDEPGAEITFIYEGKATTVSVYGYAAIPQELEDIFDELVSLWRQIAEEHDESTS